MKEKLFTVSKGLLITAGLLELALSQVHILMITKLFTSYVGFYLFIFVIAGMLILFNLSSMTVDNSAKMKEFLMSSVAAIGSGGFFIYIAWTDYLEQESIVFEDIQMSVAMIAIGIVVYIVGTSAVAVSYTLHEKE